MTRRDSEARAGLARRAVAEALGTAPLLAAVVGSGISGERLARGNVAVALLANTIATGAALVALIQTFGPVSGAHFNPAVSLADASQRGLPWREVPVYVAAQSAGALAGVAAAHLMFGLLRHDGGAAFEVYSAGVRPTGVRPEAVEAMREIGVDIFANAPSPSKSSRGSRSTTSSRSATKRRSSAPSSRPRRGASTGASTIRPRTGATSRRASRSSAASATRFERACASSPPQYPARSEARAPGSHP